MNRFQIAARSRPLLVCSQIALWIGAAVLPSFAAPSPDTTAMDPRAARSAAAFQALLEEDPRLEQPVTLRLKRSPLSAVAAELGRQTGVEIKAAPEVADEPAILFATDRPAKEIMHHLARLFNYRWMRKGAPGAYRYEIYQDLKSRLEEQALRQQDRLQAVERLQVALRSLLQLAQRSPASRALPQNAWVRHAGRKMADPLQRTLIRVVPLLTPVQWNALLNGEAVSFSSGEEPGSAPLPAMLTAELRAILTSRQPASGRLSFASSEEETQLRQQEQKMQECWVRAEGCRLIVRLALDGDPGNVSAWLTITPMALMPPGSPSEAGSVPGLIVTSAPADGPHQRRDGSGEEATASGSGDGENAWKQHPMLGRKARLRMATRPGEPGDSAQASLNELLPAIAESYGINLVADAYRAEPLSLSALAVGGEQPLYELMNEYALSSARWNKDGTFLHVRRRDWEQARLAEIPDRVVEHWAARLRRVGRLSLEDAALLGLTLRDEQVAQFEAVMREHGIRVRSMFGQEGDHAGQEQREILRAYGSLLPEQRRILQAGGLVTTTAMTPEARRRVYTLFQARRQQGSVMSQRGEFSGGLLSLAAHDLTIPKEYVAASGAPPASAAHVVRRVLFRYQYAENQAELFPVILPVVERLPAAARGRVTEE